MSDPVRPNGVDISMRQSHPLDSLSLSFDMKSAARRPVNSLKIAPDPKAQAFGGNIYAMQPHGYPYDSKTWSENNMVEEESQLSFDPIRVPHEVYLKCEVAISSIQNELRDLNGVAIE